MVLEILGAPGHEHYRVKSDEEHESIFFPGPDAVIRSTVGPEPESEH